MCVDARDPETDFKDIVRYDDDEPIAPGDVPDDDDAEPDPVETGTPAKDAVEIQRALVLYFTTQAAEGNIKMSEKSKKRRLACRDFIL